MNLKKIVGTVEVKFL